MDAGGEIPPLPFLQNEPELAEYLDFEWRAFHEVSRDRQIGFGLGPIPWTTVDRYAERHLIDDPDSFERFSKLIFAMDDAYRANHAEKNPPPKT